jgi:hypothetical protein
MDNRLFNVNGRGEEMLKDTLQLAFTQKGEHHRCEAFSQTKESGLILLWYKGKGDSDFPVPMDATQCSSMVMSWLKSEFAETVELSDWCQDIDQDGHNSLGWQVYCEGWGHVGDNRYAICGIKPAYLWYGK